MDTATYGSSSSAGASLYGVRTTGIYCRLGCPARRPRPENVIFFKTSEEARRAGFRPCKRCNPGASSTADLQTALVTRACRQIEAAEAEPALGELAREAGLSATHFHRLFKRLTGVTPKSYATAQRAARAESGLRAAPTVTHALYEAGYSSSSRFYASAKDRLGMSPGVFREGGAGQKIRFAVGACSLGAILVAATETGVCAILMGDDPDALVRDLQDRFAKAELLGGDAGFEETVAKVVGFVEAPRQGLDLPLDIAGTVFQQRVWQSLRAIPLGSTANYAEIARAIGQPSAARAVARACAANPLAMAIPCHRVVRSDGAISGYRWGIARKQALLDREKGGASPAHPPPHENELETMGPASRRSDDRS
ncbi:MAG: bifunctional DNA-binding transcriptional regulator/O6-methylguanine-DNA methyltransferase Ada [Beijerinckiaceae bacterium]|nr:bifunctional DNA-binding transcriptional regulator/O6-methylguanine-DNA methyltransferase Ada [Beijerinckiaceae bacterium]